MAVSPGCLALIACIAHLSTAYSCQSWGRPCHLGPAHPAGDRLPSQLLTAQRATLAELLAELPEADQRHLAAALESLRAVLARHPNASPLATSMGRNGQGPVESPAAAVLAVTVPWLR